MSNDDLMNRLNTDGIDNLSVVYHDYSGRACGKTVPKERFASALSHGVVFARANLSFSVDDHQSADASFLADTGDFLAVPDPHSYLRVPYLDATARVHAFMYTDDGAHWEGCPRARLKAIVDAYAERGLNVRVGLEPEFYLLEHVGESEYRPVDHDGMFTLVGLERHYGLWKSVSDDLRDMDIVMEQFGKEYGPAQYEGTPHYDEPIRAVDHFLAFKDVIRARAREAGRVVSFMPKPYAHLPRLRSSRTPQPLERRRLRGHHTGSVKRPTAIRSRQSLCRWLAQTCAWPNRRRVTNRELLQTLTPRIVGARARVLGRRQSSRPCTRAGYGSSPTH